MTHKTLTETEGTKGKRETWKVNPVYGTGNEFHLWDDAGNFHEDISAKAMERRARLIAAAPELLEALQAISKAAERADARPSYIAELFAAVKNARAAIANATLTQ